MEEIVNRVANSALVTIDLEDLVDPNGKRERIDLKDLLFEGMILREKDIRDFAKEEDWSKYSNTYVTIHCSSDAIIPTWAYMLIANQLEPYAKRVVQGSEDDLTLTLLRDRLQEMDLSSYQDAKVVVKGCGDFHIPPSCYVELTSRLRPYVSSLMFGEPCSTVPVYKRRKK